MKILRNGLEYQAYLESASVAVLKCKINESFTIEEINQEFMELLGYLPKDFEEILNNSYMNLIHPDDRYILYENCITYQKNKINCTYRVCCKNGSTFQVGHYAKIVTTQQKESYLVGVLVPYINNENNYEVERNKVIAEFSQNNEMDLDGSDVAIFEWDMKADVMLFYQNDNQKEGHHVLYSKGNKQATSSIEIHAEDKKAFYMFLNSLKAGNLYATVEFRILTSENKYVWCRIHAVNQYDDQKTPSKAVGIVFDIDDEIKLMDKLRLRAEKDALTGLYNREETEMRIKHYLNEKPTQRYAMFIIDVDDFKQINDTKGHVTGDIVLSEVASKMQQLVNEEEVVGRIGGDEFLIFLRNTTSEKAKQKAVELNEMLRHLFENEKNAAHVTGSIGIALYPEDGGDFKSLYHSADQALYQAKKLGKDQYTVFDRKNTVAVENAGYVNRDNTVLDSQALTISSDLVTYVFRILYRTEDIDQAINLILEIVGKRFDVSRAYIFENSEDGIYCSNTYEWCNVGVNPEIQNLQHLTYSQFGNYEQLFGEDSIFYCRDISKLVPEQVALFEGQGIRSTLQCAFWEDKRFCGFLGFDECTGLRLWNKEEIDTLSLISQILTTFLQKKRVLERDKMMESQLRTILDKQDAFIYVVEKDSHNILYVNEKIRNLRPKIQLQTQCYTSFFDTNQPCAHCPLFHREETKEIEFPKFHMRMSVHVAPMKWLGNDAYLFSCQHNELKK